MSLQRKVCFGLVVGIHIAILLAFIGVQESRIQHGTEVVLKAVPIDPRSLMQGDYAVLRYEIGELKGSARGLGRGETLYVVLEETEDIWSAVTADTNRPETDVLFIKGQVDSTGWLDFGIGTYFVPEGTGYLIEQAGDVKVTVSVDESGNASIKNVQVDGESFLDVVERGENAPE